MLLLLPRCSLLMARWRGGAPVPLGAVLLPPRVLGPRAGCWVRLATPLRIHPPRCTSVRGIHVRRSARPAGVRGRVGLRGGVAGPVPRRQIEVVGRTAACCHAEGGVGGGDAAQRLLQHAELFGAPLRPSERRLKRWPHLGVKGLEHTFEQLSIVRPRVAVVLLGRLLREVASFWTRSLVFWRASQRSCTSRWRSASYWRSRSSRSCSALAWAFLALRSASSANPMRVWRAFGGAAARHSANVSSTCLWAFLRTGWSSGYP